MYWCRLYWYLFDLLKYCHMIDTFIYPKKRYEYFTYFLFPFISGAGHVLLLMIIISTSTSCRCCSVKVKWLRTGSIKTNSLSITMICTWHQQVLNLSTHACSRKCDIWASLITNWIWRHIAILKLNPHWLMMQKPSQFPPNWRDLLLCISWPMNAWLTGVQVLSKLWWIVLSCLSRGFTPVLSSPNNSLLYFLPSCLSTRQRTSASSPLLLPPGLQFAVWPCHFRTSLFVIG